MKRPDGHTVVSPSIAITITSPRHSKIGLLLTQRAKRMLKFSILYFIFSGAGILQITVVSWRRWAVVSGIGNQKRRITDISHSKGHGENNEVENKEQKSPIESVTCTPKQLYISSLSTEQNDFLNINELHFRHPFMQYMKFVNFKVCLCLAVHSYFTHSLTH